MHNRIWKEMNVQRFNRAVEGIGRSCAIITDIVASNSVHRVWRLGREPLMIFCQKRGRPTRSIRSQTNSIIATTSLKQRAQIDERLPFLMLSNLTVMNFFWSGRSCSWSNPTACISSWVIVERDTHPLSRLSSCAPPTFPFCAQQLMTIAQSHFSR